MAMADERAGEATRDELIAEIRALQDELESLQVKRERIRFYDLKDFELPEVLESVRAQVLQRKKFLGGK